MPEYDPNEPLSIYPLTGEEALRKLLGVEEGNGEAVEGEPEVEEPESLGSDVVWI